MADAITSSTTVSPLGFAGTSSYAAGLQQVLNRSVGIASLPLTSLNNGLNGFNRTVSALQGLDTNFSALQISISSLQHVVDTRILSTAISDGSVISATVQTGAAAGVYSVEVTGLGAFSSALSNPGSSRVTDVTTGGITSAPSATLGIGGNSITVTPASSSLQDLVSAINTQAGEQVQATVINAGSTASPDYRLSLRAVKLGTDAISLTDSLGADLIFSSTAGSLATYKIDGVNTISSTTRTVTLSPGLTVSLIGQSAAGRAATVTVTHDSSQLANALGSFAQAYNSAVDAIAAQRGKNSGVLQGDSVLQTLSGVLSRLGNYSNGTAASALANFGVSADQSGHLSVDGAAFATAAGADFATLLSTLGSSQTGGFLKTATDAISGVEDSVTGILPTRELSVNTQIASQKAKISSQQNRIAQLQTSLTAQIAKADAAIALLESQVTYVKGLFAAYNGTSTTK